MPKIGFYLSINTNRVRQLYEQENDNKTALKLRGTYPLGAVSHLLQIPFYPKIQEKIPPIKVQHTCKMKLKRNKAA